MTSQLQYRVECSIAAVGNNIIVERQVTHPNGDTWMPVGRYVTTSLLTLPSYAYSAQWARNFHERMQTAHEDRESVAVPTHCDTMHSDTYTEELISKEDTDPESILPSNY